jgi:hypothetical protein
MSRVWDKDAVWGNTNSIADSTAQITPGVINSGHDKLQLDMTGRPCQSGAIFEERSVS